MILHEHQCDMRVKTILGCAHHKFIHSLIICVQNGVKLQKYVEAADLCGNHFPGITENFYYAT